MVYFLRIPLDATPVFLQAPARAASKIFTFRTDGPGNDILDALCLFEYSWQKFTRMIVSKVCTFVLIDLTYWYFAKNLPKAGGVSSDISNKQLLR